MQDENRNLKIFSNCTYNYCKKMCIKSYKTNYVVLKWLEIHRACTHALRHIYGKQLSSTLYWNKSLPVWPYFAMKGSLPLWTMLHSFFHLSSIYFLRIIRKHRHLVSSMHALLFWLRLLTCFGQTPAFSRLNWP